MAKMLKFGIRNVKYALPDASGSYASAEVLSMGGANNLSLEPQYSEQEVFLDGDIGFILTSDKGLNGTLGLVTLEEAYEIAMGRKMLIDGGTADIEQKGSIKHAIYFETNGKYQTGNKFVIKTWLLGVTSGKPTESFEQDTDSINPQNYEMALNILGEMLKASTGLTEFIDPDGNTIKIWKFVSMPTDTNYATFQDTVPTPKALV